MVERNKHIAILHAYYHIVSNTYPPGRKLNEDLVKGMIAGITNFSVDSLDSNDMTTPQGIGNYVGKYVADIANSDEMNSKGNFSGKKYNLKIFEDYTMYKPVNSLNQVTDPTKWQPHVEYGSGLGVQIYSQNFITPQAGNLTFFGMDQDKNITDVLSRKSWKCTAWPCNDLDFKQQTDEVLQAVANLTENKKVIIEYFNDKNKVFASLATHIYKTWNVTLEESVFLLLKSAIASYNQMVAVWKVKLTLMSFIYSLYTEVQ